MHLNRQSRNKITVFMALVCCLSILVGSFAFFTDRHSSSASATVGFIDLTWEDTSLAANSNNEFAIDSVWENESLVADGAIINPGDYFDMSYTLTNTGSKSIDVRQQLTLTSSVPLTEGAEEYKLTITGGNDSTVVTGKLSDDKLSIVYDLTDITLNGSVETEDNATDGVYTIRLDFDQMAGNAFMSSSVGVNMDIQAKQHRNTTDADWADWASYKTEVEYVDKSVIPVLAANSTWFSQGGTTLTRSSITSIEIVDWIEDSANYASLDDAADSWDASDGQVGTVTAYAFDDGSGNGTYTLTLAGNGYGSVYANPDSSYTFSDIDNKDNFLSLVSFAGEEVLDTSNATSMTYMFARAISLESLDLSSWDMGNVTSIRYMFGSQSAVGNMKLTSIGDVGNWDTSNVSDASNLFTNCVSLKELDVSNWDTSSMTSMKSMFTVCESLTQLDVSNWNTSGVTDMSYLFNKCYALQSLDVSSWDVSNVQDFSYWLNSSDNTINNKYTKLDVSGWDTSSAKSMSFMFYGCEKLTELDVNTKVVTRDDGSTYTAWDVSGVTDFNHMFSNLRSLQHIDITNWDTSSATSFDCMFNECESLTTIDVSGLETASVQKFCQMFEMCYSLETIVGLDKWDTSSGVEFSQMFDNCRSLTTIDVASFNTSRAETMAWMFNGCYSLADLDLSSFDTSNVKYMAYMFRQCTSLTELDLSTFNTSGLLRTDEMFSGCSNLQTVYVSDNWTTDNLLADYCGNEFYGCTALVGGYGTTYDESHVDYTYAHIDGGPEDPGYFTYKAAPTN